MQYFIVIEGAEHTQRRIYDSVQISNYMKSNAELWEFAKTAHNLQSITVNTGTEENPFFVTVICMN